MPSLPLVIVAPPGPLRDRFLASFSEYRPEVLDSVDAFHAREGEGWGILLLGPELPPQEVLALLSPEIGGETPWSALLVQEEDGAFQLRPISLGHPLTAKKVEEVGTDPDGEGPILEIHWVLRVVARARHDLNNPLTSGLAEAQLLLMDEHPPEVTESLETIQKQFRRLRDMVADLSRLRVHKPDPTLPG